MQNYLYNCKFIVLPQCKTFPSRVNLFDDTEEYTGYYEVEIDLKQIDPTIQSISKFQDAYKTIEISNLNNFSIVNNGIKISDYSMEIKEEFKININDTKILNFTNNSNEPVKITIKPS